MIPQPGIMLSVFWPEPAWSCFVLRIEHRVVSWRTHHSRLSISHSYGPNKYQTKILRLSGNFLTEGAYPPKLLYAIYESSGWRLITCALLWRYYNPYCCYIYNHFYLPSSSLIPIALLLSLHTLDSQEEKDKQETKTWIKGTWCHDDSSLWNMDELLSEFGEWVEDVDEGVISILPFTLPTSRLRDSTRPIPRTTSLPKMRLPDDPEIPRSPPANGEA
nr:hypothetical protein CFP56_67580 [Quercus suber]